MLPLSSWSPDSLTGASAAAISALQLETRKTGGIGKKERRERERIERKKERGSEGGSERKR